MLHPARRRSRRTTAPSPVLAYIAPALGKMPENLLAYLPEPVKAYVNL